MVPLMSLWMPIVLAAVLVFVASNIMHMVLPFHRSDYRPVPSEDKVMESLRDRRESHERPVRRNAAAGTFI